MTTFIWWVAVGIWMAMATLRYADDDVIGGFLATVVAVVVAYFALASSGHV